jgi:hypothetical protein
MVFVCLKVVLLLFLLLAPIVSSSSALEFITGLHLCYWMISLVDAAEFFSSIILNLLKFSGI